MDDIEQHTFTLKFEEKDIWHDFKEDLKVLFKQIGVKYQFSVDSPNFYLVYQSQTIRAKVSWIGGGLVFNLIAKGKQSYDEKETLNEIFDLLSLCDGDLIDGLSPAEWDKRPD
ncbi:MAG: hypothetical protein ACXAEU_16880 [Candidatus Hodarchaeales archaeon]|jgi:hypothetical protein